MEESQAISRPQRASDYPGRQMDCIAALRPAVSELAATSQESIVAAMGGELTDDLLALARRAEAAGGRSRRHRRRSRSLRANMRARKEPSSIESGWTRRSASMIRR